MSEKLKVKLNITLNIVIFVTIVAVSYSWMLTMPSVAEIVRYERDFIITSSDIEVKSFVYEGGAYVEQMQSPMLAGYFEPGRIVRYKFEVTNNNNLMAKTRIVFSNITGDVEALKDHVKLGLLSPSTFEIVMSDKLVYNGERKYLVFMDEVSIPANTTLSLFWYATIDEEASNEIQDLSLQIENVVFVKP